MIDIYSTLPKKNNHCASCERVAGRPTAAILDALPDLSMTRDGAFAGGLVLSPTRGRLRKAVKAVNQAPGPLRLEKQREKAFIRRIEKGFDFLGYHLSLEGPDCGRGDPEAVRFTCNPALWARAGRAFRLLPAWVVR
ncbi:MAG: hypothetical protein ABSF52_19940 [Syntrophobacteraceae bacterium]|jgi:hypothetical protein